MISYLDGPILTFQASQIQKPTKNIQLWYKSRTIIKDYKHCKIIFP